MIRAALTQFGMQKLVRAEFWKALDGTSKLYGGDEAQPPLAKMDLRRLHHVQVSRAMGGADWNKCLHAE